jgi:dTDP-glucose 4,6-dehydratase
VHLAAESHVGRSIDCRDEFLRTNVGGTGVLLEVALAYWKHASPFPLRARLDRRGVRLARARTSAVDGAVSVRPNNPYAASKAASDFLVRSYFRTFGFPAMITHCSNNYGPRQHPEKLIPTLIRQAWPASG